MKRVKTIELYEASDGTRFGTEKEAAQHNMMLDRTDTVDGYLLAIKLDGRRLTAVRNILLAYARWSITGQVEPAEEAEVTNG